MRRRGWNILRVATRHRLDTLLKPHQLAQAGAPWWIRTLVAINPLRLLPTPEDSDGQRLRAALVELGPIYIKLGQLLSTRPDVVPPGIAQELALLQDDGPPIPTATAIDISLIAR